MSRHVVTTGAQSEALPVGTTFVDKDGYSIVKVGPASYASAVIDLGNGNDWTYFDQCEIDGSLHDPEPSPFLPMTIDCIPDA